MGRELLCTSPQKGMSGNPSKTCTQVYLCYSGLAKCQYWLWPPWAPMTAWQWQCMEHSNIAQHMLQCHKRLRVWDGGFLWDSHWSSACPRRSVGFKSGERAGQGYVWMFWCCRNPRLTRTTCGLALSWWNIPLLMFVHRIDVMLQDLISISDACQCTCHMHNSHPTIRMDSCPDNDTTKMVDLLQAVWSIMFPSMCVDMGASVMTGENEAYLRTKQSSTWCMSISPSAGTTADVLPRNKTYITLVFYRKFLPPSSDYELLGQKFCIVHGFVVVVRLWRGHIQMYRSWVQWFLCDDLTLACH